METVRNHTSEISRSMEVSIDHIEYFRKKGHVIIDQIFENETMVDFRNTVNKAVEQLNTETRRLEDRDTYGKAFLQVMNLWRNDEEVAKYVLSKRLGSIAAQLLGVEKVRIYHDQALFKEPGGGPTPWHQDQYYWPIDTPKTITMWMPMVNITEGMGMLTFASGSHQNGRIFETEISDESDHLYEQYVNDYKFPICRSQQMKAGDASWHYGYTIHNAPGNESRSMREVMTIIYIADGARVSLPQNSYQENDLAKWMPGLKVGDLIDSELNPTI